MRYAVSSGSHEQRRSLLKAVWLWVCHSSLFAGCLVGALISVGVPRAVASSGSITPLSVVAMSASGTTATDPLQDLHQYWQSTYQSVFGAPLNALVPTFQLRSEVSSANWLQYHKGFNEIGGTFGVELVLFHQWEAELDQLSEQQRTDIAVTCMVAATVMGVLHGTNESETPFHGIYLSFFAEGAQRVHHLIPLGDVSTETIKAVSEANAINASTQPGGMSPRQLCLFLASAAYKTCIDQAELALVTCLADAKAAAVAAAAVCALTALIPMIGWGAAAACVAAVWAAYYVQVRSCNSAHENAVFACKNTYQLDRLRCAAEHAQ